MPVVEGLLLLGAGYKLVKNRGQKKEARRQRDIADSNAEWNRVQASKAQAKAASLRKKIADLEKASEDKEKEDLKKKVEDLEKRLDNPPPPPYYPPQGNWSYPSYFPQASGSGSGSTAGFAQVPSTGQSVPPPPPPPRPQFATESKKKTVQEQMRDSRTPKVNVNGVPPPKKLNRRVQIGATSRRLKTKHTMTL
jgi:hypothetical protein